MFKFLNLALLSLALSSLLILLFIFGGFNVRVAAENFIIVLTTSALLVTYRGFKKNGNPLIFLTLGFFVFFANRIFLYRFFDFPPYWVGEWFYFPSASSESVIQTLNTGIFFSVSLIVASYLTRSICFSLNLSSSEGFHRFIAGFALFSVMVGSGYSINIFLEVIRHGYSNIDASITESNKVIALILGSAFPLTVASLLTEKYVRGLSFAKILFLFAIVSSMLTGSRGAGLGYFLTYYYISLLKKRSHLSNQDQNNFLSPSDEFRLVLTLLFVLLVAVWWGWGRETGGDVPMEVALIGFFIHGQGINIITNFIALESPNFDFIVALSSVIAPIIERFIAIIDSNYTVNPSIYRATILNAFPDLISYSGNSDMYLSGRGIGGSMLSEFYFLSGAKYSLWMFFVMISTAWLYLACRLFEISKGRLVMLSAYFSCFPFFILAFRDTTFAFVNPWVRSLLVVSFFTLVWRVFPKVGKA